MQKWGKNRNGSIRFRCKFCYITKTRKRSDLSKKYQFVLFQKWLLGKNSLSEIAIKYKISRQTLHAWFSPFWDLEPTPKQVDIANKILIIDGKYVEQNACVLLATSDKKVTHWHFTQRENYTSWSTFLGEIKQVPFAVVCDGQKGMFKALKERFPDVVIQRCQFHVMQYCTTKITKNPESEAAQMFRKIVLQIPKIKTKQQLKLWFVEYKQWSIDHKDYLKEKTIQTNVLTPTGRYKWHYTHAKLHAAYSHVNNAIPFLFRYLQYSKIPNTTNFVEGAINSQMQEKLRFHRGLKLSKRRILIAHFLSSKQH